MIEEDPADSRLFLASDQIWPSAINRNFPGARFVARCRLDSPGIPVAQAYDALAAEEIWGVVIEAPLLPAGCGSVDVVDDFGVRLSASFGPELLLGGDPESLFMASRYWELHPDYIQKLREVLQAGGMETSDDEPRDDGALNSPVPPSS